MTETNLWVFDVMGSDPPLYAGPAVLEGVPAAQIVHMPGLSNLFQLRVKIMYTPKLFGLLHAYDLYIFKPPTDPREGYPIHNTYMTTSLIHWTRIPYICVPDEVQYAEGRFTPGGYYEVSSTLHRKALRRAQRTRQSTPST